MIIEPANKLEMSVGSLSVDNAVPLLGHEQEERETEVRFRQGLSQSLG